ncbi:hypothetical protein HG536_0B01770 [Torulaspora globosa]|uniref:SEC7 domain-containing protein n=1 Tax=Torulaspora globosa TaxID=48254 RepID=A0A7G3ZCS8_9SACH|nr:uncharacterized protein HG536_0B01770 [Torulaspora globosa]QLL31314.1 hypothetical protein HG536_0B01770 [Torulaspora globosa]
MNQSLAMLMKLKLFQAGHPDSSDERDFPIGHKKDKKHKLWGKSRLGGHNGKSLPELSSGITHESPQLKSIGEEESSKARKSELDPEGSQDGNLSTQGSGRRNGKLRNLKHKISLHDIKSFRSSSSQSVKQADADQKGRPRSSGDDESSHALDNEMTKRGNGEVARAPMYSTSSVWSARSPSSAAKTEYHGHTSTASSVRFSSNITSSRSHASIAFHHSRSGSMEVKGSKIRSAPMGRRRSRTVGGSDCVEPNKHTPLAGATGSDFMSSITSHLGRSRSSSQASRSPLISSQSNSHIQFPNTAAVRAATPPTPPRLSNGTIPFPTAGSQQAMSQQSISRRSSSLVNAFNSFVNLRSSSASSMKGPSVKTLTPKFDISLDDFSEPPEPTPDESPKEYLLKLGQFGKFIGIILCSENDPFKLQSLKYFLTHYFDFNHDPLDISLRKLLMFLDLPKETQQIDRLLSVFSQVYYEVQLATEAFCPWSNSDQVYFVAFSLLMLHTDYFNPRNRFKMTKCEFIGLVHDDQQSDGFKIPKEILAYYYDNIVAKESPKFDFFSVQQPLNSSDVRAQNETSGSHSSPVYSPIEIINAAGSLAYQDQIPVTYASRGRVSSNSYSSYFPHVPISTSSSSASVLQDDVDIYSHILENSLSEMDMSGEVNRYWDDNCISRPLTSANNRYAKYFSILKEIKGGYLKIRKDLVARIALPNFEILNESDDDYRYLKIIQMGEIQHLTINKKFSIVGAVHKISWKKEYAILTPSGLLIFDCMDWVSPDLVKDEKTGTSNYIIEYKCDAPIISESPICCNGLLAIRKEDEMAKTGIFYCQTADEHNLDAELADIPADCIMHLHGSQKVNVWKCSGQYERDNWIDAINLMAAYDGCYYKPGSLDNSIMTLRKHSMKERISKLEHSTEEKAAKLRELQTVMPLYRQCMPLSYKTRNELTAHIKQLAVRMDWLVYETKRNEVYLDVIRQVDASFQLCLNKASEAEDFDSRNNVNSIHESFIFSEELIPARHAEDSSKFNDSLEIDTNDFFLEGYNDR